MKNIILDMFHIRIIPFNILILLLITFSFGDGTYSQTSNKKDDIQLSTDAVGVVSLLNSDSSHYYLDLIFPAEMLRRDGEKIKENTIEDSDSLKIDGNLLIIDSLGVIAELSNIKYSTTVQEWCENDGGYHLRPEIHLTLEKSKCKRTLIANKKIDNIVAFAFLKHKEVHYVDKFRLKEIDDETVYHNIHKYEARLIFGGKPIAHLFEQYYDGMAGCGYRFEKNALILETCEGEFDLCCCGP